MFDKEMEKVFDEIENRFKEAKERYRNMEITKDGIKKIIDDPRAIRLASMFGISKEMLEDYYDNYCDKCHSSPCVCKKEEKDNNPEPRATPVIIVSLIHYGKKIAQTNRIHKRILLIKNLFIY